MQRRKIVILCVLPAVFCSLAVVAAVLQATLYGNIPTGGTESSSTAIMSSPSVPSTAVVDLQISTTEGLAEASQSSEVSDLVISTLSTPSPLATAITGAIDPRDAAKAADVTFDFPLTTGAPAEPEATWSTITTATKAARAFDEEHFGLKLALFQ